jgi:ABC-type multidrug transport system ATPase subunit
VADYAVKAQGLVKRFGSTEALAGLNLRVQAGTVFGLLGPNGAGKTTCIRVLSTLLRPDAGRATVAGHDVLADPAAVRRAVGLAGQYASLDDLLTGRQNLVLLARLLGWRGNARMRCWSGSTSPAPLSGRWRPTRGACVGGSTSPPPSSASRRWSCSTSRRAAWTP